MLQGEREEGETIQLHLGFGDKETKKGGGWFRALTVQWFPRNAISCGSCLVANDFNLGAPIQIPERVRPGHGTTDVHTGDYGLCVAEK